MSSLRGRFAVATAVLVTFQLAGAGAAGWAARRVADVVAREQQLAAERATVLTFGEAVREQYVHQAHTFIEGGTGHLDHYEAASAEAEAALGRVEALGLDGTAELRTAYTRFAANFRQGVIPVAARGELDRPMASGMHASAERLARDTEARARALLDALAVRQATLQAEARAATRQAVLAVAVFSIASVGVLFVVTRSLASAVVGPLERLSAAAERFGAGDPAVRAELPRDVELRRVAETFNRMVERVTAAEARRVRTERLAALGEMSGAVAHELLNPLTTILGATTDPVVREEAAHARRVVEGLLGFARPGRETADDVDLVAAVQAAADRFALAADARDVRVRVTAPTDARLGLPSPPPPPGGEPPVRAPHATPAQPLRAPPSAVRQILDNLVRNAVEAAPADSEVEIALHADRVEVRDRGAGVPAALRARLYEPFVTGRRDGTGLGLAVCQRIATALGGGLSHADRDGGGTIATWRFHA